MDKPKYTSVSIEVTASNGAPNRTSLRFIANSYQLFFNAQHLLIQLSTNDRAFFDYLCEVMRPADNDIYIDANLKTDFIEHIDRLTNGKTKFTEHIIAKSVTQLRDLGLILPTKDKARYVANPKHVFKGSASQRTRFLKVLIESRIALQLSIAALLNEPEDVFLARMQK